MLLQVTDILQKFFPKVQREYLEAHIDGCAEDMGIIGKAIDPDTLDDLLKESAIRVAKKYPIASQDLFRFDPLLEAREAAKATGENPHVFFFAFADLNRFLKTNVLKALDDVSEEFLPSEWERVLRNFGFELGLELPFECEGKKDKQCLWYHPKDGVIVKYDTWDNQSKINSAELCFNWQPSEETWEKGNPWPPSCGGGFRHPDGGPNFRREDEVPNAEMIYVGSIDIRDGMRVILEFLRTNGAFISPWVSSPSIYWLHYGDKDRKTGKYPKESRVWGNRKKQLPKEMKTIFEEAEKKDTKRRKQNEKEMRRRKRWFFF